ncbi:MAG: dUTP diphosphatase [Spirochaetaceae bacterium]|nr:dUTP diphosphatase [Spirochaetaceae bacterium]
MQSSVIIKCFCNNSKYLPFYASKGASGADIFADIEKDELLKPGERKAISSGLKIEIPEGYEAQIRPRSGLALKYGITVLNTPGTIDSDYRGEVKVIMINLGTEDFIIKQGDRIAQMIIAPVTRADFRLESNLNNTERGEGGFGSTGS